MPGDPLRITTDALPSPVVGKPYREAIVAVGGLRPYQLRLDEGSLPAGLSLQGGLLIGTPTRVGDHAFVIAVSDGALASTFRRYQLTVVDVPVPRTTVSVPETEVRDGVTLRVRVDDADRLRAVRFRLRWDDPSVTPADVAVRPSRNDVRVFFEADDGMIAVDLVVVGPSFTGDDELVRIDLAIDEPTRLGFDFDVETLYAGRHVYRSERIGARTSADDATDEDSMQSDDPAPGESRPGIDDSDPADAEGSSS